MEYLPYAESLEDGLSKINCSFPKLKIENNDCVVIEDSCEAPLFDNDAYSICSSSDDELYGFDTPKKDKHNYILNLMKKIEAEISEETDREKDVIDGIEFLSFASEQELMDYAKAQQDLRANASQSDDGLEILDDGTFSDISSNHAIVPTKTKDITRIKGWRNKHFAGINVCDDSGSSLRNDDDGFGDDFDIKSVQDESSEELDSVAASTTSKSGFEGDTSHEQKVKRIDSPIIEDSNAVDNAEGFSFHNSNKSLSSTSLSSRISQTLIASNSTKSNDLDFSFDNFDIKGIFTSDKLSNISEDSEKLLFKKINDPFLSPMIPISRNSKNYLDNKVVYKPRVKQGFLDSIAKKVNAQSDENVQEESIASLIANNKVDRAIRWRVPREKLLSGDIYDVEFSPIADCEEGASGSSLGNVLPETVHKKSLNNEEEPRIVTASVELGNESIAAFRSTTLEHYTTNLDELHIDFPIPKLDASDNVTHDEILLPIQDNIVKLQQRQKSRPPDEIKAKTVAEKRRLLTELSFNQRSKRKQKLSFKLRANNETTNSKRIKRLRGQIVINTEKAKTNPLDKKAQLTKALFNEQGVITYGREKPLKSAISKSFLAFPKSRLSNNVESAENSSTSSKIGMILNIGVSRPLYKEASDNVKKFAFDDDGNITAAYAAFSSSAVQDSRVRPFTVKRILVPAVDDTLKKIMYNSINSRKVVKRKTLKNKPRIAKWEIKLPSELTLFKDAQENLSEETKQFVKHNNIDNDVFNITTEMLNYVELKECFQNLEYEYDPDVPIPVEKENIELSITKLTNNKRKKTKLQRQIEILGGTFIAVQGEEGNEENLAKHSEENKNCLKESCKMGCVCYYRMLRDEHCGKEACMFFCHCPSSARRQGCEIKSKIWLLPEVLRHHNVSQSKLAPVEREYHQTVIMSKDKKITIETKHKKRERKLPSKYKDEILFGYTKGNALDDNEDDDCLLVSIEDERATKQNCQEYKEPSDNSKKRLSSPMVSSAERTLENPTLAHDSIMKIKPCYVKIEQNNTINQMAAELTFTPGVHINTHKYSKSPKKSKTSKGWHRNVARKKTGSSNSHGFDVENSCSRTHGITEDYVLRNYLGKVRTKNLMLYASVSHSDKSLFILPHNNCPIIKEDLVEISDSENEIEEKSPNEEERDIQIKFVRSLPQHLFEEQRKVDQDENAGESNETTDHISLESSRQSPNKNEEVVKSSLPTVGGNKRFVYASLPKTDNECKWWVVELDSEKFTDLVYYSDKRALSFPLIKKAVFDTEYSGRTIKLALNNPQSLFKDKFGAYVVGGHKHLIFFGPYELSESHGLTAIRYDDENFPMKVPFTTKFSMSENFKSLGINMSQMKDGPQSVLRAVNAVWWYSTGKKGTVSNVAESRSDQEKQKFSSLATSHNENCSTYESQQEFTTTSQGIETDLHDTVIVIEDDITIEQDPLKIEPYDDYEDSMSYCSIGENSLDAHKTNTTTIDCRMDVPQTNCQLENTEKVESKEILVIGNISSVETPETCQLTPSINSRSLLTKNVAKISTVKSPVHPEKQSPVIPSKRKGKSNDFTKVKRHRKEDLDKEDIQISSLKKKIENLEEAIKSKKLEMEESQNPENFSEIDFESDSSSFSDEELYKDIIPEKSDDISLLVKEDSNVRRIVHKGLNIKKYTIMGRTPKSKESTPGILPPNLLLKTPREGPCPEKALFCLTPGIGFIPVVEFDPRAGILVIQDPCNPLLEHLFQDKTQAADWLNQYFLNRFIVKPKFDMQWVIMTGSVVRQLQPLNKDIFKYSARSLTIRPSGLELGQCRSMDFVNWEHQEVSLLEKKITNKSSCKKKEQDVKESRELQDRRNFKESTDLIENRSCSRTDHNDMERMRRSELAEIHNNMERMRRSELAELTANLGKLVFPEERASRLPKIGILTRAVYMCEAQKLIEEELRLKSVELKKKRDKLNEKLKGIFADIVNHEEKKRALELCKHVRCNQYKLPDMSDKYFKAMRDKEMSLVSRCCKGMKFIRSMRPESNLSMKSSSSSGSLGSSHSNDATATTHDVSNQQPARSTSSNQEPALETSSNQQPAGARSSKQPTEGVLRKSNKLRSITAARPDLQIFPASRGGEVISLVDSDDDDRIIEIESEEEDVIWLPDKEGSQQKDEDVEIVFSNFKKKRPKLKFPKPKRKLPQCSPQRPAFNLKTTVGSGVPPDLPTEPRIRRLSMESGPSTLAPAPVAMVLSPALMERHRLAAELANKQSGPEFVAVDELDYEPIYCEFESGCSRTDPVPAKYAAKQKQTAQRFIPIQEASVVNIINPPAQTTTPTLQRSLATPFTGLAQIRLKNMTPIGHINPHDNLSKFRGRPVLVRKSNEGFQISKLPTTTRPHLTPLSATPVMITETSGNVKTPENVSLGRDNTVTLYHPVDEISVTKTVQFANLNSVQLDIGASSMLSGPKIRKPREDGISGSLRILLPKRS